MRDTGNGKVQTLGAVEHRALYTSIDPLQSMTREEKLDILRRVDKVARAADQRVQEVSASLSGVYELILIAATDGTLAADVRPLVRLSVSVLVEEDGKRERGSSGGGGRFGYDYFLASRRRRAGRCLGERSGAHGAGQPLGGRRPCGDAAGGARRRLAWRPAA